MDVAEAVGRALVAAGVDHVFGVVGSGNFHVTNAMVAAGARFVAARHEGGGATMADAYARTSGRPAALTVHQGCGLTNAMTGIAEAAKSRTPLVVLAPEAPSPLSNFHVDQAALARAVGAVPVRVTDPSYAVEQAVDAVRTAVHQRATVLLNLPLDVQASQVPHPPGEDPLAGVRPVWADLPERLAPSPEDVAALTAALLRAQRPVLVAGRGSRSVEARDALVELADRTGALLATSAVAKGLFRDHPWSLDVSGGFSSPLAAELIAGADLIVGWGCALNMWTMRQGALIGPDATVVQVDDTADALGTHRELSFGVHGDVAATARAVTEALGEPEVGGERTAYGYRSPALRERLATSLRWRDVPYVDRSTGRRIDPRTLSVGLDEILPAERVVGVDSGNFMGYPSMYLSVPDERGFCFTQAFQSIGLGLATTIGAALAQPDRLPVATLGDGGLLMSAAELDTVRRLGLPMVVVVYNDEAYGAEVHHFGPGGHPLETVTFPETDIAAVARGYGFTGITVRTAEDLSGVLAWLEGPRDTPLLIDAKVVADEPSWWLEEAFRGH
ncbi:thiamine pyrophosphate-binding protein [Ornithinicoccus hortensis]|uniref:Thiamine pyrophosphate-dependent acetolactate synthase large subunit-like protein n=1 Tax=Ornithinicoccus hortensis TaxID=82346 RepID=A0A542YSD2_9MICO|nr:thiamine pyrophosphate-binding protein [Ornithinicoccus hortensis]TQL50961.1 thiamine pyrophosphate-dependent acetolactate synthase large subunit-like protein [Ornithinicoccus hortensis]